MGVFVLGGKKQQKIAINLFNGTENKRSQQPETQQQIATVTTRPAEADLIANKGDYPGTKFQAVCLNFHCHWHCHSGRL